MCGRSASPPTGSCCSQWPPRLAVSRSKSLGPVTFRSRAALTVLCVHASYDCVQWNAAQYRARRSEEESLARRGRRQTDARHAASRDERARAPEDVISGLARAVREVEAAVQRRRVTPAARTKFQAVALGVRAEHARIQGDQASTPAHRAERQKRLDGVATILAKTAVRDPALL